MSLVHQLLRLAPTAWRCGLGSLVLLVSALCVAQERVSKVDASKSEKNESVKKVESRGEQKAVAKLAAKPQTPVVVDEKAALQFASTHHPELAEILQTLRKSSKQQFQAAITDLSREQERLSRLAERDPERAKIAIAAWQIDSRIRLEVARFTMTQDAEREARIKELLKERFEIRRQLLEFDLRRTRQRLAKYEEQYAQQKDHSDKQLAAEWERLKKSVAGQAKAKPRTDAKKKD